MQSDITNTSNCVIDAPKHWDPETMGPFQKFSAAQYEHGQLSVWRPTKQELAVLNGGGVVVISAFSEERVPLVVTTSPTSVTEQGIAQA